MIFCFDFPCHTTRQTVAMLAPTSVACFTVRTLQMLQANSQEPLESGQACWILLQNLLQYFLMGSHGKESSQTQDN